MSLPVLAPPCAGRKAPRAAFGQIVRNEARLAWRNPAAPKNPGGFVLALVLSIAALFALGLSIAAAAKTAGAARGIMAAAFYPLMFFSGLYFPMQLMPAVFGDISRVTPLGAAVQALQDSMLGRFPPAAPLLVMVAYAAGFGYLAERFFRWE